MVPDQPRIVGFLCHWCAYRAADLAGSERLGAPPGFSAVRVLCSSRVEPEMALSALRHGADGVLVVGCRPGGCHYGEGNLRTLRRFTLLRQLLTGLGIEADRVQVTWASAAEATDFSAALDGMAERLRTLPPLPWAKRSPAPSPASSQRLGALARGDGV